MCTLQVLFYITPDEWPRFPIVTGERANIFFTLINTGFETISAAQVVQGTQFQMRCFWVMTQLRMPINQMKFGGCGRLMIIHLKVYAKSTLLSLWLCLALKNKLHLCSVAMAQALKPISLLLWLLIAVSIIRYSTCVCKWHGLLCMCCVLVSCCWLEWFTTYNYWQNKFSMIYWFLFV